jgi:hypothetical protein
LVTAISLPLCMYSVCRRHGFVSETFRSVNILTISTRAGRVASHLSH